MNPNKTQSVLFDAVSGIDGTYVEEVIASPSPARRTLWKRVAAIAATIAVLIGVGFSLGRQEHGNVTPTSFFVTTVFATNNKTEALAIARPVLSSFPSKQTNSSNGWFDSAPDYIYRAETGIWENFGSQAEHTYFNIDIWLNRQATDLDAIQIQLLCNGRIVEPGDSNLSIIPLYKTALPVFLREPEYVILGWLDTAADIEILLYDGDTLLQSQLLRITPSVALHLPGTNMGSAAPNYASGTYQIEILEEYNSQGG